MQHSGIKCWFFKSFIKILFFWPFEFVCLNVMLGFYWCWPFFLVYKKYVVVVFLFCATWVNKLYAVWLFCLILYTSKNSKMATITTTKCGCQWMKLLLTLKRRTRVNEGALCPTLNANRVGQDRSKKKPIFSSLTLKAETVALKKFWIIQRNSWLCSRGSARCASELYVKCILFNKMPWHISCFHNYWHSSVNHHSSNLTNFNSSLLIKEHITCSESYM